eukprot:6338914-Alexandrium_andersonii.AAC.1
MRTDRAAARLLWLALQRLGPASVSPCRRHPREGPGELRSRRVSRSVSYTHLRAHETSAHL